MSKIDTLFGFSADYDNVFEPDQILSPTWSTVQNITFSLDLHSQFKAAQRPKSTVAEPTAEGWDKGYRFSLRTAHEQGFYSPVFLGYGEAETFGREAHEALRSLSSSSYRQCPLDLIGSELEQTSSSNEMNSKTDGDLDLAFPYTEPELEPEGTCETMESNSDRQWEGVLELVHELTALLGDSTTSSGNVGPGIVESDEVIGDQLCPEFESPLQALNDLETLNSNLDAMKGRSCGGSSADEIMNSLSAIQRNVETMKAVVPRLANERHKFTHLMHRQAAAAAGAVKLISQLADAAVSIIPEIQRQVDQVSTESCQIPNDLDKVDSLPIPGKSDVSSSDMLPLQGGETGENKEILRTDPLKVDSLTNLTPSLAAISISATTRSTVGSVSGEPFVGGGTLAVTSASELPSCPDGDECSSLVADLLEPGDHKPGGINFVTNTLSGSRLDQLWSNELDEVVRTGTGSLSGSGTSPFVSMDLVPTGGPSGASAATSEEGASTGVASSTAQEESDEGDTRGGEQLPAGSYTLMEIDDLEILTEQTHFCTICSKKFKRDANLRMHMRSHGGKFKSSAALIRKERAPKLAPEMVEGKPTRYSCPSVGCNRNMKHPKFQALKTMLCLKNHYRRSHCPKTLKCSICKSKQFSVVADLKTHEKHCGNDKWACSCGTTFSRKEKLYGHVSLFIGHIPMDASMALNVVSEVDISSARDLATVPVQHGLVSRNGSSDLWQDWENITNTK